MFSGDEFYGEEVTSPTFRPIAPRATVDTAPVGPEQDMTTGTICDGWRIVGQAIYGGFDFFAIAFIRGTDGASIGDLVRSEHGRFFLRPHQCPYGTPYYNRWLYPIEPAQE